MKLYNVIFTEKDCWWEPCSFIIQADNQDKAYEIALSKINMTKEDREELYSQEESDFDNEFSHVIQEIEIIKN